MFMQAFIIFVVCMAIIRFWKSWYVPKRDANYIEIREQKIFKDE
ncbi:hypothetical protein ACTHS9_30635 [Bacillus mycoides]